MRALTLETVACSALTLENTERETDGKTDRQLLYDYRYRRGQRNKTMISDNTERNGQPRFAHTGAAEWPNIASVGAHGALPSGHVMFTNTLSRRLFAILPLSAEHVARTRCVTDRQTDTQTKGEIHTTDYRATPMNEKVHKTIAESRLRSRCITHAEYVTFIVEQNLVRIDAEQRTS